MFSSHSCSVIFPRVASAANPEAKKRSLSSPSFKPRRASHLGAIPVSISCSSTPPRSKTTARIVIGVLLLWPLFSSLLVTEQSASEVLPILSHFLRPLFERHWAVV